MPTWWRWNHRGNRNDPAFTQAGVRPLVELGFMPQALSTHPEPYRHKFPQENIGSTYSGWGPNPTSAASSDSFNGISWRIHILLFPSSRAELRISQNAESQSLHNRLIALLLDYSRRDMSTSDFSK